MNFLAKENHKNLALIAGLTLLSLAVVEFGFLGPQLSDLRSLAIARTSTLRKLEEAQYLVETSALAEAELNEAQLRLDLTEEGMASGDLYDWTINALRDLQLSYGVEVTQFSQVEGPMDMSMLAQFPYQQINWTVAGSAKFHNFGRFLADFENRFPCTRVLSLRIEHLSERERSLLKEPADSERLYFKMQIAALVKPNPL